SLNDMSIPLDKGGIMRDMVRGYWDVSALIRAGVTDFTPYGDVQTNTHNGLIQFNYTRACNMKTPSECNWFELNSRGHIYDAETGEQVARPFQKFFNYGQIDLHDDEVPVSVHDKVDGSLGILYRRRGEWYVTTRG